MKHDRKTNRVATIAAASALGIGALAYGLRAFPAVQQAIAQLRTSGAGDSVAPPAGASTNASLTRNALLVSGQGMVAGGIARNISFQKDGTYTGTRSYAYYGFIKVQAVIKNRTLTDVTVLEYPNDNGRSHYINNVALPYLIQEAVDAQSYKVDFISGATFTSDAFTKSLQAALKSAGL
jgi:uncharacterized protein with FMN-binding domain